MTETIEGRFVPWESSLDWESYLDLYCLALRRRGIKCVKYVPSIEVDRTSTYRHRFGHEIKRVPVRHAVFSPSILSSPKSYLGGITTTSRQLEALGFSANLLLEARKDRVSLLHYASYYSSFFVASFLLSSVFPIVAQYTGGALHARGITRLAWRIALIPRLKRCKSVLVGPYPLEVESLLSDLGVEKSRLSKFNAPVVDQDVFREEDRDASKAALGFDTKALNILAVTFVSRQHDDIFAKDPYAMVDVFEAARRISERNLVLNVVGFGPGMADLQTYVARKGLGNNVVLHGKVEHRSLPAFYSASDLVFIPYPMARLNEGSVMAEGFSCGRPVAAFRRTVKAAIEQPGGFLVDYDPELGGREIAQRIQDAYYLRRKELEGKQLSEKYSISTAGETLEQIYHKALEQK